MRTMLGLIVVVAALGQAAKAEHGVGLAIGGYGASNTIELVTADKTCAGTEIDPPFPVSPSGSSAWIAEYVDNAIYICGGQVTAESSMPIEGLAKFRTEILFLLIRNKT